MATLNDLAKKVRNTTNRLSNLFIQVWTGSAYEFRNMGRIQGAEFTSEPLASDADQDGRESSQLFNITVSWSLMQTSNEELSMMGELAIPSDATNFPNGHRIYASGNKLKTKELNNNLTSGVTGLDDGQPDYTQLNSIDPDGLYFRNVLLKPSPEINLSGENAMIGIEFTGTVETDALDNFDDTTKEDANWIVVSPE